jgi:tripartite-type tricarboxylate transporter receptor subunit TctC
MNEAFSRRTMLGHMGLTLGGLTSMGSWAQAPGFPSGPIKIIMPWAAGGGGDVLVRAMTTAIAQRLGQPVVVDNRPGAIGTIGSLAAARSPADGHTLVYGTADSHSIAPHILKTSPYDSKKDFVAVAPIGFTPLTLIVHASHPAKSFEQYLQMARQTKEPLTYGSWGQGSSGQITMEALKQKAKIDLLHIPYNGTAPLMQAQLANQINSAIVPVLVADQHVKSGLVRMLAVTARERLSAFPDVPIMKEMGVEIDMGPWLGFLAPAGTPPAVVEKLNAAIAGSIAEPQVAEVMKKMTMVIDKMNPVDYQKFVNNEYDRWGSYIRTAKITMDL